MSDLDQEIETLCFRLLTDQISRASFIERCLVLACLTLDCSMSALWMFVDTPGGRAIRCVASYSRTKGSVSNVDGQDRLGADLFFHTLIEVGQVVASDAREHPAASVFVQDSAIPLGVRSVIATPCFLNGRLFGAFVCTHVVKAASWSIRELFLLRRLSVRATTAMASMARPEIEGPPLWYAKRSH